MKTSVVSSKELSRSSWLARDRTMYRFTATEYERLDYIFRRRDQLLQQLAKLHEEEVVIINAVKERND